MKAWTQNGFGTPETLELHDVPTPAIPDDHVLIRVRACSVNPYDWHMLRGDPRMLRPMIARARGSRRDAIPGADVAGVVESVGSAVTRFSAGDEVYGEPGKGGFAEYVTVWEQALALKPSELSFEEAGGIPMAAFTALQALRDHGRLQAGQSILINGAGGGIGTFAIQFARAFGAGEITAVCGPGKAELVRSLGATRVVDYSVEDFTRSAKRYDLILDIAANRGVTALRRALSPRGTLVLVGGGLPGTLLGPIPMILRAKLVSLFVRQRFVTFVASTKASDLDYVNSLVVAGKLRSVVGHVVPFAEAPQAIRLLEEGHATGKIVVTM